MKSCPCGHIKAIKATILNVKDDDMVMFTLGSKSNPVDSAEVEAFVKCISDILDERRKENKPVFDVTIWSNNVKVTIIRAK